MACTSWDDALWEGQHFCDIPAKDVKDAQYEPNHEARSGKPSWEALSKISDLSCTLQNIKTMSDQESQRTCSRLKATEETSKCNR